MLSTRTPTNPHGRTHGFGGCFWVSVACLLWILISGGLVRCESAQSTSKVSQNEAQILEMGSRSRWGGRLFAERADLHKTCTGVYGLHVHPPWRAPFPHTLAPERHPKVCWESACKTTFEKITKKTKKGDQGCPKAPRMAPWATTKRSKFSLGSARAARRCPRRVRVTHLEEKGLTEPPFPLRIIEKKANRRAHFPPILVASLE